MQPPQFFFLLFDESLNKAEKKKVTFIIHVVNVAVAIETGELALKANDNFHINKTLHDLLGVFASKTTSNSI